MQSHHRVLRQIRITLPKQQPVSHREKKGPSDDTYFEAHLQDRSDPGENLGRAGSTYFGELLNKGLELQRHVFQGDHGLREKEKQRAEHDEQAKRMHVARATTLDKI